MVRLPSRTHLARRRWIALAVAAVTSACSGASSEARDPADVSDPDAVRYRLLLRENPVDRGAAFRCYGGCQGQPTPSAYLQCLTECPGFDVTEGVRCADHEVPPIAACFTARHIPKHSEPEPGWVVLAIVANMALIVTLASVCASSSSQCGYGYQYAPPGPAPY